MTPAAFVNGEQPVRSVEYLHWSKLPSDPEQFTLDSRRGREPSLKADPGKASAPGEGDEKRCRCGEKHCVEVHVKKEYGIVWRPVYED